VPAMPNLTSIDAAFLLIAFFVPGFVISTVRAQFLTGNEKAGPELYLRYLTYSALNYAIWSWLIYLIPLTAGVWPRATMWAVVMLVGPFLLGGLMGLSVRKNWSATFLEKIANVQPVHPIPSAWDWRFHNTPHVWVQVVLKSGTQWCGYMNHPGFAGGLNS
jgi:hypothetical protein